MHFQKRIFNPLFTGNPLTDTLTNSEEPDEMRHYADFIRVYTVYECKNNPQGQKYIVI